MPEKLKRQIMASYLGKGRSKKDAEGIAYATMTNMQKQRKIEPWRKLGGHKGK